MDREPSQANTFCKKCCRYVKTTNFLIHQGRCNGISSMSQSRQTQRIFNNSKSFQNPSNENQVQTIPCHFCGYLQTLAELDTHPNRCEHREQQCPKCHQKFPRTLMSQHQIVCPAQQQEPEQAQQEFNEREENYIGGRFSLPPPMALHRNEPFQLINLLMMNDFPSSRSFEMRRMVQPRGERVLLMNSLHHLIQILASESLGMQQKGLSKGEIEKFPVSNYKAREKSQSEEEMCIICYCNFEEGQKCLSLPCKHIFHPECIGTWLQKNPTCPVCKRSLKKEQEQEEQRLPAENGLFRMMRRF